jgi:phage virion morphogenesis protein
VAEILRIEAQLGAADALLLQVIERIVRPTELLGNIGAMMERNINLRFETKTDPSGAPWQALADSTLKSYARKYKGAIPGSLLERTRHMRDSLTHNVIGNAVEVGFSEVYAQYHETGSKDGKHPPRRGLLTANWQTGQLGAGDEADLVSEVEAFLAQNL